MLGGLESIDFGAIEQAAPVPLTLQQDAAEAIKLAKIGTVVIIALQAIAALSALGVFMIQAKTYSDSKKRRRSSRRSKR